MQGIFEWNTNRFQRFSLVDSSTYLVKENFGDLTAQKNAISARAGNLLNRKSFKRISHGYNEGQWQQGWECVGKRSTMVGKDGRWLVVRSSDP